MLIIAIVAIGFTLQTIRFADAENLRNILLQASATTIAAIGMTFVLAARGIDLSVGSIANLTIALAVALAGTPLPAELSTATDALVYPVVIVFGIVLGLVNGALVNLSGVSALIITLGTLTLYRGLALHLTKASLIPLTGAILSFARTEVLGIDLPIWSMGFATVLGWYVLARMPIGRLVLAVGGSPRSATETGIAVWRVRAFVFALSGFCAAVSGLISVGRVGVLNSDLGFGFEFTVITAVALGGTSLFGGRASVVGTVLGAMLLTVIQNGLNLIGADPYIYDVVRGGILLGAVSIDAFVRGQRPMAVQMSD